MNTPVKRQFKAVLLMVVGLAMVIGVRSPLFETERRIKVKHDVYFLPPPEQLQVTVMGYNHAVADLLWAHILVSQGLHTQERRRYENLGQLYDALHALTPKWRTPYLMVEALITFQTEITPHNEVLKVRSVLETGVSELPSDGELWLDLGTFVSFFAPDSLLEPDHHEEALRWRQEGVAYLARAAELGAADSRISWQALGGAKILSRAGKTGQAIQFLERTYRSTDDQELKASILQRIEVIAATEKNAEAIVLNLRRKAEFDAYRQRLAALGIRAIVFIACHDIS